MAPPYTQLEADLTEALSGLDAAQTQMRPVSAPGKWSIQQIVEHLLLSYRSTVGIIQQRIDKGSPTKASPTLIQRAAQFTIISLGRFPGGRPAPPAVTPAEAAQQLDGAGLTAHVHRALDELNTQTADARRLFGSRRFASHLILGPLSLPQWSRFHLIHGRHHIRQIRAIRNAHSV